MPVKMQDAPVVNEEDTVRLRSAVMRLGRDLRKASAEEGLTTTQSAVLATVVRREEMPLSQLAGVEGLNPTMLSRVINHLEEADLLVRVKNDDDRRSTHVRPTASGKKLITRLRNRRTAELTKRIEDLSPDMLTNLVAALPALETLAGLAEVNA